MATIAPRNPFLIAADRFDPPPNPYADDPSAWVSDTLGEHLWSKQAEVAQAIIDHRGVLVPSCHTSGKSFVASRTAAWWIDNHPPGEALVVTTAPSFNQVRAVLWQEIGNAHRKGHLVGSVNQTEWWIGASLAGLGRKPADTNPTAFQGMHRKYVLAIIDEADGVSPNIWAAVRSITSNRASRVLAIGNPVNPLSEFARLCAKSDDEDSGWHKIQISAFDTPNFTGEELPDDEVREFLLDPIFEQEAAKDYGVDSPYYASRILAQWPKDAEATVIPLSWVEVACTRWRDLKESGQLDELHRTCVGVDLASRGADKTVIAERCGDVVRRLVRSNEPDLRVTREAIAPWIALPAVYAVVDADGIGDGVVAELRGMGLDGDVVGFHAGYGTERRSRSGELGFVNTRSAAWWGLRERLHPISGDGLALPPDERLIGDLTTPKYRVTPGSKIQVESKDEIKKRLGRSTDDGDAVMMAFWDEGPPSIDIAGHTAHKTITGDLLNANF